MGEAGPDFTIATAPHLRTQLVFHFGCFRCFGSFGRHFLAVWAVDGLLTSLNVGVWSSGMILA